MIELKGLSCRIAGNQVLHDISCQVNPGDVIALIGPSGAGKSTLLRCINLLEKPESGEVWIRGTNILEAGTDIQEIRKHIGMVFQSGSLFSHRMLIENVMMGPVDLLGKEKQAAFDTAKQYLKTVGLGEKLYAYPDELSGGQRQRGEIARCLAMEPDILLLDEPTSALDISMRGEVQAVINRLAGGGRTMMLATRDFRFCRNVANRIFYVDEGTIYEEGTPEEIFEHPKREKTRAYVRQLRSFRYVITSRDFDLYALNAGIESFCRDYFLTAKQVRNLELVLEELVIHTLLAHTDRITIEIRYFEDDGSVQVLLLYDGPPLNPFRNEEEDVLSMLLVRQFADQEEYHYENEQNRLSFRLRV